jgi:hypothetical protein
LFSPPSRQLFSGTKNSSRSRLEFRELKLKSLVPVLEDEKSKSADILIQMRSSRREAFRNRNFLSLFKCQGIKKETKKKKKERKRGKREREGGKREREREERERERGRKE